MFKYFLYFFPADSQQFTLGEVWYLGMDDGVRRHNFQN
jgi:hypothetical protein